MSAAVQPSLFFLRLPDLTKLVCLTLSLSEEDEEPRTKQHRTCRELVLLYSDVLASPALDSFTDITVVMAMLFFQKGIIQGFAQRHHLQLDSPQCVLPGTLQCCLSYSLITRLAPSWNKAGVYLISGKNFLTDTGRMNAVSMELSTRQGQLCICIEVSAVRLPPTRLEDFNLAPLVLKKFCSDPDAVLDPGSTGGAIWCHVLPSMKKGEIITISRRLPRDGPFRTYRQLQDHWNCLYGYRLPDLAEEEAVYCSVYFRLVGDRIFTYPKTLTSYPLSCIRLQPVQRCPRVNLQGTLGSFLRDVRVTLQRVCGSPAHLTSKPRYCTVRLNTAAAAQVRGDLVNVTTTPSSRLVLTQLPAPLSQTGPQLPFWTQQAQAQGLNQRQGGTGDDIWPLLSSSSSSRVSCSSGYESGTPFTSSILSSSVPPSQPAPFHTSSSSSSVPLSQPAPFHTSSSSSSVPLSQPAPFQTSSGSSSVPVFQSSSFLAPLISSSSSLSLLPLPAQTQGNPAPKLVPIFKNKRPSCHVNVALLGFQKQQQIGGVKETWRMTIPSFGKSKPTTAPSSSSSVALPLPPLLAKPHPSAHPKPKHIFSPSPESKCKPGPILMSKLEIKPKPKSILKTISNRNTVQGKLTTQSAAPPEDPHLSSSDVSSKGSSNSSGGISICKSKVKNSRVSKQDVDVEKMARSNQWSRLNSATLLAWLKRRGMFVGAKHKKEELMLKVMGCLAED